MIFVDWLYLLGVSITWVGNTAQIVRMWRLRDARALSMWWLLSLLVSILLRLPRAATAYEYPIWVVAYITSGIVLLAVIITASYLKIKGGKSG